MGVGTSGTTGGGRAMIMFLTAGAGWEPFTRWVIWRFFLDALWLSVQIAAVSMLLSLVVGITMSVARLARPRLVRWPAAMYVEGFRATPLLLLIFFVFFGSARTPLEIGARTAAIIALTLYNSAVIAEIMRAGILSISRGIIEASRALGLTYLQAMRYVAVPMALRRMAPGVVSQLITLFKDTSLAGLIGVFELARSGRALYDNPAYGNAIEVLTVVAFLYFVPSYTLSLIAQRLELGPERRAPRLVVEVAGA
jgi:aspartate/glutamate/glutamine transport system permease protein